MLRTLLATFLLLLPASADDRVFRFAIDQDRLAGAPDFSFLNRPLGPADRLFVRDGHFHRAGPDLKPHTADDERVRLFGVNLCFGANFPEPSDAPRIAKRLRRLGVNLVRLHHMDSSPDSDPENARSLLTTGPYPTLNSVAVARLRSLLDALKAEGVYINLNLHVGYRFRPEIDKVPPMPPGAEIPIQSKPLHIFHPRMIELQAEYARKVISALGLKNDPVLAMVEANNETSLLEAWQRGTLQKVLLGEYKAELDRQFARYLKSRAISKDAASEDDFLLFLADRDRRYLARMLRAVRKSTGPLVPFAGTQMGYGGLMNLDSHADVDYQDNHFYIDHYNFPNVRWDQRDWRIRDSSAVGTGLAPYLNMAIARESGRPYTVSEYNQQWPNRQGAEIDPTLAAFAAFQDWDSIMHFAYAHGRNWDAGVPNGFNPNGDWTKFPNLGQSAWLFRTAAVRPAEEVVEISAPPGLRLRSAREKRLGNIAAFLNAEAGYDPAAALVHRVAIRKGDRQAAPEIRVSSPYRADTGDFTYDRDRRLFLLHVPKAAGVFGFLGAGMKAAAGAVEVELAPASRGFVTILLTARDDRPIENSGRMLLSTPGYTLCTLRGSDPPRPQKLIPYPGATGWWTLEPDPGFTEKPSGGRDGGSPPVWMERVESYVTLRTPARALRVHPLDGSGARLPALGEEHVTRVTGGFRIHLQADGQEFSPWYEILAEQAQ